jgi:hypothetical protein
VREAFAPHFRKLFFFFQLVLVQKHKLVHVYNQTTTTQDRTIQDKIITCIQIEQEDPVSLLKAVPTIKLLLIEMLLLLLLLLFLLLLMLLLLIRLLPLSPLGQLGLYNRNLIRKQTRDGTSIKFYNALKEFEATIYIPIKNFEDISRYRE